MKIEAALLYILNRNFEGVSKKSKKVSIVLH